MTLETRPTRRALRHLALGTGAALCAIGGGRSAAGDDRAPAQELLRIASDEPLIVRFATPVAASRVGSQSFRIVRESDGAPADGRYVAGTFADDPSTGVAMMIDPQAYIDAAMVVRGLERSDATDLVERTVARYERTGRTAPLNQLRTILGEFASVFDARLDHIAEGLRSLPQQDASAPAVLHDLRRVQAGDDALWEAHIAGDDHGAFSVLAADPRAARFHHSTDPLTGQPYAESDYRRQVHRRYLMKGAATGRVFTFVPDVPQTAAVTDIGFTVNERYRVTLAGGLPSPVGGLLTQSGPRAAIRRRVAHVETRSPVQAAGGPPGTDPQFALSELDGAPFRVVDVTPPNGERLVDPSTDWENPDNRFRVPLEQRRPFVARVRFNQPLDPRTVSPTTFTLTERRASVGTANERIVQLAVPVDVRLRQSRLGDVEVEIAPRIPLDPAAQFEINVRNLVSALDRRSNYFDFVTTFTTAPIADQIDVLFDDFYSPWSFWVEAGTASPRGLVAADAAHDPAGLGLFVPFLFDDPTPVAAIESTWRDSRTTASRFVVEFDDPATPQIEGTNLHAPEGSSVRLFARTAPTDIAAPQYPNLYLVGPWIELDPAHPEFPGNRFFQMRIEFTLPPGATPATPDLPYVERISVVALRP